MAYKGFVNYGELSTVRCTGISKVHISTIVTSNYRSCLTGSCIVCGVYWEIVRDGSTVFRYVSCDQVYEATDRDGNESEEEEEGILQNAMESAGSAFDDEAANLLGTATSSTKNKKGMKTIYS